jgi:hypothetical protein
LANNAQASEQRGKGAATGRGVYGVPVLDPTENVKALSEAANKRQDDLREAENRRQNDLRDSEARLYRAEMGALTTIVDIYGRHAREKDDLRAYYEKMIRDLDKSNQVAIRQIDVSAVSALAVTTTTTAESLRSLVQNTATTIATQTANTFQLVIDRVAALEKTSYEGSGKSTGTAATWTAIFGGFLILSAVVGALAFFLGRGGNNTPVGTTPPQIIYVQPAPAETPKATPR